jgi:hypothetical protein
MLLVIFGAGASYDSVPSRPPKFYPRHKGEDLQSRLPLADELFSDGITTIGEIEKFSKCQPIVPYLQSRGLKSIEAVLENLRDEASGSQRRSQQLAAIRYYLQFMLSRCEQTWKNHVMKGISNYKTLLDQIEVHMGKGRREPVCFVTFNYDTLIEDSLPSIGVTIEKMDDYISYENYSLIKLHGSVNWGRKVEAPVVSREASSWEVVSQLVEAGHQLKTSEDFFLAQGQPIGNQNGTILFPALAIPVETKKSYECPTSHVDFLKKVIPKVKKVLIVGWRGAEAHFLTMLRGGLSQTARFMIVTESQQSVDETTTRLQGAGISGPFSGCGNGFTSFVVDRAIESFLAT